MILKKEHKNGIFIYTVSKQMGDFSLQNKMNKYETPSDIFFIINHDADVYTEHGALLLRFRKNILKKENIDAFYDNTIEFSKKSTTTNRGNATTKDHRKVHSNILGYYDRWGPSQKYLFKRKGLKMPLEVHETRFNIDYPDKFAKIVPLIQEIDLFYKKFVPREYSAQKKKAEQTFFKIADTSFTTITTNMNYRTTIHTDKGDDIEGFGNLTVIERGEYTGGETCFTQYGIGVDVRNGDVLFMDVHQPHANLPITQITKNAIRFSIVCYLRKNVWLKTKDKSKTFFEEHNKIVRNALRSSKPAINKTKKINQNLKKRI